MRRGVPTFNVTPVKYPPKRHVVYFVEASNGLIKIGTTANIEWRLASLQAQSPLPLKLLATVPGKRADEFAYHRLFAQHRAHGEWFQPSPSLLAEIERLGAGA